MPLTTAVTQYAAPYVILASDVTAAAQAAGLQYATQADIRALSGAFAAGITKEDAIAGITTQMEDNKLTGEEFKAYLVSDRGFTEGQAEAYYNANKADIDSKLTLGTSSVIREGFTNLFTDTEQFLADNPSVTYLTFNDFKSLMVDSYGFTEDEFYASMGDTYGTTRQDIDANLAAAFTAENYSVDSPLVSTYIDGVTNTVEEVTAAYRDKLGATYEPTAEELAAYVGISFSLDGDNNRVNDRSIQELLKSFTEESDIGLIMESLGYKRYRLTNEYGRNFVYAKPTGRFNENGGDITTNRIREEDLKNLLTFGRTSQADNIAAFEAYVAAAEVDENGWLDPKAASDRQAIKDALEATGLTIPAGFDYDAFAPRAEGQSDVSWETGLGFAVDDYKKPRQYTRTEAIADLETELGRSLTQEEIDDGVYDSFLDGVVQLDGNTDADATGKTQVETDITNADDVRSYLQGLDYDTTGLSNEDLLAFAGTGLGIDLGTATSDYQTANETIAQRDARLEDEAKVAALETEIKGYLDDPSQDGGAYTDPDHYDNIVKYLSSGAGRESFEAMDAAQRKNRVQVQSIDPRRYSESEAVADIKATFPADKDLSVEDLKAKYPTLFALVGDGNLSPTTHEANQKVAFDEGTITGDEANAYFRDVLGYGEGWIPTGNIASRLVGVGNEATVLPEDIANLTGKTLDLYNETTVTQDEVMAAMIANPTDFGFADAAAVAQAVSDGLDLSAYTGRYWQAGAEGSAGNTGKSLVDRLDDDTISQDEIDAYLTEQGYDPATAGTFDSSLGFGTTSVEDITSSYRGGVDADRAEADELAAKKEEIEGYLDDTSQDGGAYSGFAYNDIIHLFTVNPEGKANFDAADEAGRKALVQGNVDRRRYSESEIVADIKAAFPADADLSVEDLKTKYSTLFDLVGDSTYNYQAEQEAAFGAATTTEAEARKSLEDQGYVIPEGFDFTNFTGVMDETQLANNVYQHLSPLQYTRADAEAALAAELGRPLTAEDLTTYESYLDGLVDMTGETTNAIGDAQVQGDITSEQDVRNYLSDYTLGEDFSFDGLTGLDVDLDDALGEFKADNRTTAQNQIAADLGTKGWADASDADIAAVESLDSAGRDAWIADRQFTRDQAIAALDAQGIDANHSQFESLITQLVVDKGAAGTFGTQGALVDNPEDELINQFITTQAEVDAAFGNYGYFDPTDANIPTGVIDDSTLEGLVETYVDDNYVSADEARAALDGIAGIDALAVDDNGDYVITDDQLVGMGLTGQYSPADLGDKVNAATTTEQEVRDAFGEDYTPTDAEIARYVGLLPDGDLGTDIPAYVADRMDTLVSDVGDLALTVGQLQDQLNGALADGGSLDQAVSKVADDLNIAEDALLKLIGDNSNKFDDLEAAFGTQATDDQEATGIWANIADLERDVGDLQDAFGAPATDDEAATGIYGIIDQVAEGVLSNDEALELLGDVIGNPAVADNPLTVDIDESSPATGIYAQSGEGVNADVLKAINAVYDYGGNAGFASSATLDEVAAAVGKPAQEVTQEDIDAVNALVQGSMIDPDTGLVTLYDAKYDVNADGILDTRDQELITAIQEGDYSVYGGELATDSLFANTGFYDIFDQNRYDADIQRQQDQDIQNEINEEINNQININAEINRKLAQDMEDERIANEQRRLAGQLQAMGRGRVTTPDVAQIDYLYDVYGDSPFATPQQESFYRSPYSTGANDEQQPQLPLKAAAEGGLIEDETDELMKLLGI